MTNIGNAPMTSSIFSPQPSHVKPITPDKKKKKKLRSPEETDVNEVFVRSLHTK
jgi:hypothetical protein